MKPVPTLTQSHFYVGDEGHAASGQLLVLVMLELQSRKFSPLG
jgi:hypothetical protein